MIAADTSTWIAYFGGERATDTDHLEEALVRKQATMVPAVLAELFSSTSLPPEAAALLDGLPCLELAPGYWKRTGRLRAAVLAQGRRARLGDALIAQCCMDGGVPLVTRDGDFRAFAAAGGLELVLG